MATQLEKAVEKVFIQTYKALNGALKLVKEDHLRLVLRMTCKALENEDCQICFHIKPKKMVASRSIDYAEQFQKFAIVLQGPIDTKDDFTLNTVCFYKSMYPSAAIIVSTWDDENEEVLRKLAENGAVIVKSRKPDYSGVRNINFQIVNSLAGLLKARELGYEYAVKTRTDQRLCREYVFCFILSMLKSFPPAENSVQKKRVAVMATHYGNMFTPYFVSDFLYMGCTEDIIDIFSLPLDDREEFDIDASSPRRLCSKMMHAPEIYILKHYLTDKLGRTCEDTVKAYWQAVKDCLICLGMKDVDLLWPKYDIKYELNYFYGDYFYGSKVPPLSEMGFDFINWFCLYNGSLQYRDEYEKYADERLVF